MAPGTNDHDVSETWPSPYVKHLNHFICYFFVSIVIESILSSSAGHESADLSAVNISICA